MFKCHTKLHETSRLQIKEEVWAIGDHDLQRNFVFNSIGQKKAATGNENARATRKYRLKMPRKNGEGVKVPVCKTMFLHTLNISERWLKTISKKLSRNIYLSPDKRGKHQNRRTRIAPEIIASVKEHILSIPRVESHYIRAESWREYFEESLTIRRCHDLYLMWMTENHPEVKPKKDQFDQCVAHKNAGSPENDDYQKHMANKAKGRDSKNYDKAFAIKPENIKTTITACFDYQKVLQVPKAETSILYYKRKLSLYNFTVHDIVHKFTACYCYDESVGCKGSNEVASFIRDFVLKKCKENFSDFRFYSDNCSG